MSASRQRRVAERLKHELGELVVSGELRDPRAQAVVITRVWLSADLQVARVHLRTFDDPGNDGRASVVAMFQKASKFLRGRLARRVELRRVPSLEFFWDEELDRVRRVDSLVAELAEERSDRESLEGRRKQVVELIRSYNSFCITCHRRPDGDALGSALGLAAILRALGKKVFVYHPDELPASLEFLVAEPIVVHSELPEGARFDATFVTDTAAEVLLPVPFPSPAIRGTVVVLDHHLASEDVGDVTLRDVDACATGEVVWSLLEPLGFDAVPKEAAAPLYASIVADTGGFRYPNTSAATLRMAADLLDAGAKPWVTAYNLFEGWPYERVGLLRDVLESLEREFDGQLALLTVDRGTLERNSATDSMVDGLVNYGRRVRGVEVAALLWERPPLPDGSPVTKVSLRSRGAVDVSAVALSLGGGGHRQAAAAEVSLALSDVRRQVVAEVGQVLRAVTEGG